MKDELTNSPKSIALIKYVAIIHLALYSYSIYLSLVEGQSFQILWVVHTCVVLGLLILNNGRDSMTYYTKLSYVLSIPTVYLYKYMKASEVYDIPMMYWALSISIASTLYVIAPMLLAGRDYYLKSENHT